MTRLSEGLTAIDFRAGLALLPMLPMSPADFWLILRGLSRGRIAQFDRPDMERFRRFIAERREQFADLQPAIGRAGAATSRCIAARCRT